MDLTHWDAVSASADAPDWFAPAVWRETVIHKQFGLECRPLRARPFMAGMRLWDFGPVKLVRMRLDGHSVSADRCVAHAFAHDCNFLKLVAGGAVTFEFDNDELTLRQGSMVLVDPTRDFNETFIESTDLVLLVLPKRELRARGYVVDVDRPAVQDASDSNGRMLWSMILSIAQSSDGASTALRDRIGRQLLDLMDMLGADGSRQRPGKSAEATRLRIKNFLKRNLGDAEIGVPEVAAAMGMSARHINRLLRAEGTSLMRFLVDARLEQAHRLLIDPAFAGTGVEEIAWRCGFAGGAQFSRAFKRRYGEPPRRLRSMLLAQARPRHDGNSRSSR